MYEDNQVHHPLLKLLSVFALWLGSLSWGEVASIGASFYTLLLIVDWFWRRLWRPFFIRRGWLRGKSQEYMEDTESGALK